MKNRKLYMKNWRRKNREHIKAYNKHYKALHKKEINLRKKQYSIENRERISEVTKAYKKSHKAEISKYNKEYAKRNKDRILRKRKKRLKNDLNFKLREYLRVRLQKALKGNPKLETTMKLVGCSIYKLKEHLEKQFKSKMTWNNYGKGGWEIDHIIQCVKFDLTKKQEQKKCFHYTNLQPLWVKDNRRKNLRS